jgi:membrane associated rhomboid family serine protease
MAFGSTPKYVENIYLDHLTAQQFLVIAVDVAKKLGWDIRFTSDTGLIALTNKGMFKWNAKITIKIEEETVNLKSESTGGELFDLGRNKKTIAQFTNAFYDLKNAFAPEELSQKYEELKPALAPPEQDILSQPPPTSKEKIGSFFSFFKPRAGFFVTPLLVYINMAVFLLMVISGVNFLLPDNESLIRWGANFRPITLEGQWWRLITNFFLHIGIMHLLLNMYALLYIGLLLEPYLDKAKFIAAYFLTGIIASITSLYWHDLTISAGASGAIFGMYGVFLAMLTTNIIDKSSRKALLTSIGIFVGYNLLYGTKGGIDNAAHVGGLLSGFIIGYAFYPSLKKPASTKLEYAAIAILAVVVFSTSFMVYHKIPNDIGKYDEKMNAFASMENAALTVYHMPKDAPKEKLLAAITDSGIYYWNRNIQLLNEMGKLNIPKPLQERVNILTKYCNLRLSSYHFIYKAINEDTDIYKDSIQFYNKQIEEAINSLKQK